MKKVFNNLILIMLGAWILSAQLAHAQNQASSGTLMASVMEQVGYKAQTQVLTQLGESIESLGSLIYLGVLVSAIMTVGLMGNYKAALWILVGPPIFAYMSGIEMGGYKNTTQGAGVEWRFGAFQDKQAGNEQDFTLEESEVGRKSRTEVSFVFHRYNMMISEIYQKLISVITNNSTRSQMMFMTRTRMMEDLFGQNTVSPGLVSLAQHFLTHCGREISEAVYLARGLRDPARRNDPFFETAKKDYCDHFAELKPFPAGPAQDYLYSLDIYEGLAITKEENENENRHEDGLISCKTLWNGLMKGAKNAIKSRNEQSQRTAIAPAAWQVSGAQTYNTVMEDILKKITIDDGKVREEKLDNEKVDCIQGEVEPGGVASNAETLAGILGAYLIKKTIITSPFSSFISQQQNGEHGFIAAQTMPIGTEPNVKEDVLRRQQAHQYSEARRYHALTLITFLPYLQGMILYVLSILYPFFCLMLLVPGQAGTFFVWMAMWAWAKSWDVGWAFVMVADEVIWELMPKTAYVNPEDSIDHQNPVTMLEIAFDGDPSYNTATYWMLLMTMVSGVPMITANMILGAKKAVSGVLLSSFTSIAEPFSMGAADWVAGQGREYTARRINIGHGALVRDGVGAQARDNQDQKAIARGNQGPISEAFSGAAETGGLNADAHRKLQLEAERALLDNGRASDEQDQ